MGEGVRFVKNVFVKMYYKVMKKFFLWGLIFFFMSNKICLVVVIRSNWFFFNRKILKLFMVFIIVLFLWKCICYVDELFCFFCG